MYKTYAEGKENINFKEKLTSVKEFLSNMVKTTSIVNVGKEYKKVKKFFIFTEVVEVECNKDIDKEELEHSINLIINHCTDCILMVGSAISFIRYADFEFMKSNGKKEDFIRFDIESVLRNLYTQLKLLPLSYEVFDKTYPERKIAKDIMDYIQIVEDIRYYNSMRRKELKKMGKSWLG